MPDTVRSIGPHPVHAILLAFPVALFTTALATDIAYLRTQELQWTNFSAWLIAGGVVFTGLVLAWALVSVVRALRRDDGLRRMIYAGLLVALLVVSLLNAFQHSRDGWSSVGAFGLVLSVVSAALALAAAVIAHTRLFSEEVAR
ncbi:MAG: hypothetical protein Q7J28_12930 [Caulobacter sp.]|nr:hypothetical protein [Caulobacter sp.]